MPSRELSHASLDNVSQVRMHNWFEESAARYPDVPVLYSAELSQSVSYRELNERSNQRAHCKSLTSY